MLYEIVEWSRVEKIPLGLCGHDLAESLGVFELQTYHHPIYAIVFASHPVQGKVEVAVKLSESGCSEDVSYKLVATRHALSAKP